ncbi:MAG: hypothetical protein WBB01_23750 [Phormidesmis sp.]
MSDYSFSTTAAYSPALLALKRFVRGTLRQVGIGVISLMVILSMSTHPVTSVPHSRESPPESSLPTVSVLHSQPQYRASQSVQHFAESETAAPSSSAAALEPFPGLRARMVRPSLTTARLSVPESTEQAITSLAEAE